MSFFVFFMRSRPQTHPFVDEKQAASYNEKYISSGRINTMDTNTIQLILWAPFAVVGLLAMLIYCIKGLCKGIKPALVSLVSILAATLVDILLARLLAGILTPALLAQLPEDLLSDLGSFASMVELLMISIISTIVAMLLFMLLLLILTPIIEAIGNAILRKKTTAQPITGGERTCGALLGMVSALLFSLIFLMPIYGTLASYAPPVRNALDMISGMSGSASQETYALQPISTTAKPMKQETQSLPDDDLRQLLEILDCILQHPLVELSSSAPVQSVYTSLSQVNVAQTSMNLSSMADTINELMARISRISQVDNALNADAWRELVQFCREEVLTQDWAYTVYAVVLEEASLWLAEEPDANEILDILTFDEEEFRTNANAILDFAESALDQNALAQLESGHLDALLGSGLLNDTGKLLNATQQMAALKNLLYRRILEAAVPADPEQVRAFSEKYPLEQLTDPALQKQEIEAFAALVMAEDMASLRNFFLLHPSLGESALTEIRTLLGVSA